MPSDNFYTKVTHSLRTAALQLLGVPPVANNLVLNGLPQPELEFQDPPQIGDCPDLPNLTKTEQALAKLWGQAAYLSFESYQSITEDSSFDELTGIGSSLILIGLRQRIEAAFDLPSQQIASIATYQYSILKTQASFIDQMLEYDQPVRFITTWLSSLYERQTPEVNKKEMLNGIPPNQRSNLLEFETAKLLEIGDIAIRSYLDSQIQVFIKSTIWLPSESALANIKPMDLEIIIEPHVDQGFQVVGISPLIKYASLTAHEFNEDLGQENQSFRDRLAAANALLDSFMPNQHALKRIQQTFNRTINEQGDGLQKEEDR